MGYGSYKDKEPNMDDHDHHYKDPRKVVLKNADGDSFFEEKFYYLSLESMTDVKMQVLVKPNDSQAQKNKTLKRKKQ